MTTTNIQTYQAALNSANPNELADVLRSMAFGYTQSPVKAVFAALTGAATYNITSATLKAGLTSNAGIVLAKGENLPAIGNVKTLRITAATTATVVGSYVVTDAGGTTVTAATSSAVGLAKLSDDGTTLTFPSADVTAFVLEYFPAPAVVMTAQFIAPPSQ